MADTSGDKSLKNTHLAALEMALENKFKEVHALAKISARINEGAMLGEVLDKMYEYFRPMMPFDRLGFALLEPENDSVRIVWARSRKPILRMGPGYRGALKGSTLDTVIRTGQPRVINDLEKYLAEKPTSESTRLIVQEGIRSSFTCPLITNGKAVGLLFFSSENPNVFDTGHIDIFLSVASELAALLDRCLLYQKVIESTKVKSQVVGLMIHDMRGPLGALQGYLKMLLNRSLGDLTPLQNQAVTSMTNATRSLINVLNDVIDMGQLEGGHLALAPQPCDPESFFRGYAEENRSLAELKSIRLSVEVAPLPPLVIMDPRRIRQALDNLLSNAIKYSDPNTEIKLKAQSIGTNLVFAVTDQGLGIAREELPLLFRPFGKTSTLPTAGEFSTGLGLVIVKRIAEAHGGRATVESRIGEGSTFTITFPLKEPTKS